MEQMRIAMLSVHSSPVGHLGNRDTGGMSVYIRELAREFGRRGHGVDIFTRRQDPEAPQVIRLHPGVRLFHLGASVMEPYGPMVVFPHLPDLLRDLERFKTTHGLQYHVMHSHYWLSGRLGTWAASRWRIPHLFTFHTVGALKNLYCEEEREPSLRVRIERQIAMEVDRVIAATELEKQQLTVHYRVPPHRIGVVPCGVDLKLFRPMNRDKCRADLGFGLNDFIVLYVGRFAKLKRIDRIVQAMDHLRHIAGIRLVIVGGDGRQTREELNLQSICRALKIHDRVIFVGRVEQSCLPTYYNAANVLVLPSEYESFGLVGLEALACGLPVVATRVGGLSAILRENVNGHLLKEGSSRAIARGIEKYWRKEGGVRDSLRAVRDSVNHFAWSNVASAILHEYAAAISPPLGPCVPESPAEMSAV